MIESDSEIPRTRLREELEKRLNETLDSLMEEVAIDHLTWVLGPSFFDPKGFLPREKAVEAAKRTVADAKASGKLYELIKAMYADEE